MLLPPSGVTYLKLSCPGTSPSVFSPSVHVDEACNPRRRHRNFAKVGRRTRDWFLNEANILVADGRRNAGTWCTRSSVGLRIATMLAIQRRCHVPFINTSESCSQSICWNQAQSVRLMASYRCQRTHKTLSQSVGGLGMRLS